MTERIWKNSYPADTPLEIDNTAYQSVADL